MIEIYRSILARCYLSTLPYSDFHLFAGFGMRSSAELERQNLGGVLKMGFSVHSIVAMLQEDHLLRPGMVDLILITSLSF